MVATPSFLNYYWDRRGSLLTPPSIGNTLQNSGYEDAKTRAKMLEAGYRYDRSDYMAELTAGEFSTVQETALSDG